MQHMSPRHFCWIFILLKRFFSKCLLKHVSAICVSVDCPTVNPIRLCVLLSPAIPSSTADSRLPIWGRRERSLALSFTHKLQWGESLIPCTAWRFMSHHLSVSLTPTLACEFKSLIAHTEAPSWSLHGVENKTHRSSYLSSYIVKISPITLMLLNSQTDLGADDMQDLYCHWRFPFGSVNNTTLKEKMDSWINQSTVMKLLRHLRSAMSQKKKRTIRSHQNRNPDITQPLLFAIIDLPAVPATFISSHRRNCATGVVSPPWSWALLQWSVGTSP